MNLKTLVFFFFCNLRAQGGVGGCARISSEWNKFREPAITKKQSVTRKILSAICMQCDDVRK